MQFLRITGCCLAFVVVGLPVSGQARKETLRGTVIAANGKPAAGAVVWAAKLDFENRVLQRRETIADAHGGYQLDLDAGGWYVWGRLGAQGGEGPRMHQEVKIEPDRMPAPVTIQLEERGTLCGRLLEEETNKPIAGGKLYFDAGLILTTDAQGRFETSGLRRGNHEAFIVSAGRLRTRVLYDTTGRADTELEVPVPAGGTLVGRVTDLDDKPIPHAYVGRGTSGSYFSSNGLYEACDADGKFTYHGAATPGATAGLSAGAPGYVEEERPGATATTNGKPTEMHFRLRKKPTDDPKIADSRGEKRRIVSGVVRGPNGKPVGEVLVRWGWRSYVGAIETRTDADGRFRFTVPDGPGIVAVLPRNLAPALPRVEAGGDKVVAVQLDAGRIVRGQVIDDLGRPLKDVWTFAQIAAPEPGVGDLNTLSEASVTTDAQGRFEVKGVPDGAIFSFLRTGLSDLRYVRLDLEKDNHAVTMTYGGALKGRVVDRDGRPLRNFRVLVSYPRERQAGDQSSGYFAGYSGIGVRFTSADGSFVLTGVGAGSVYRVTAIAPGHGEAVVDRVVAVATNRLDKTEASTLRAGLAASLRVRAVDVDDRPIPNASVTLVDGQNRFDQAFDWHETSGWANQVRGRTADDGWAAFPDLSFSGATVLVQAPGYARQRLGWRDGRPALTFKMAKHAILNGEVCDAAGMPIRVCYVTAKSTAGDQVFASVGPADKGRFRIAELSAGPWALTIRNREGRTLHDEVVNLNSGDTTELTVKVK